MRDTAAPWLSIVGVGEDGIDGLAPRARAAIATAEIVFGGARHLDLVDALVRDGRPWPTPLSDGIAAVLALRGRRIAVLASGDPFWFGVGAVLAEHVPPAEMTVHPAPSTLTLACARLGWHAETVRSLGLHARPIAAVRAALQPGARLLVLLRDGAAVDALGRELVEAGCAASICHVLERLGGARERVRRLPARDLVGSSAEAPVTVAVEVEGGAALPSVPGLPDDAFRHDGQLTKREVRAVTLARLAPAPGALLWDIGAGAGSIGIEWLRADPTTRAIGLEARPERLERARANATALGVPRFDLRLGSAPDALGDLPTPQAIFIGGGASLPGVIETCLAALAPGGRLVVNAVALETQALLIGWCDAVGGTLTRLAVEHAEPVGRLTAWRPAMAVVQWVHESRGST